VSVIVRELKDVRPPLLWEPRPGAETNDFVDRKHKATGIPRDSLAGAVFEAQQILGRCVDPKGPLATRTGLVVGYVQSGKTLSFTTLTALAHDNGFGLIILIAGVLNNLKDQTEARLGEDLGLAAHSRPWLLLRNPVVDTSDALTLQNTLRNWSDPDFPAHKKKVCLVTILKHSKRMGNLREVLGDVDLKRIPTLLIDDEADQATLNTYAASNRTKGQNRKSSNYAEALELKSIFPHHTYVQYTATPQANLLVDLADELSPEFGELVTPGPGYVGGQTIFAPASPYAKLIPDDEATATRATSPYPPASLVSALKVFLLTACVHEESRSKSIRTMMVHPSQKTLPQKDYLVWTRDLVESWKSIFATKDQGLIDAFTDGLRSAHGDLQATVGSDLPSLQTLVAHMSVVLNTVVVREVNSTGSGSDEIRWSASEYWVLIGGAKLDRGFTVEGLVLTYMPRPLGDGNADSLQQRARFYGYKAKYLPYCRVYVPKDVKIAFEEYVVHEQDLHESIDEYRGYSLREWVRNFMLHGSMNLTRKGVMGMPMKEFLASKWIEPQSAHVDNKLVTANQEVFEALLSELREQPGAVEAHLAYPDSFVDRRDGSPRNMLFEAVPLATVLTLLLEPLSFGTARDELIRLRSIVALQKLVKKGEEFIDVFLIGNGVPQNRSLKDINLINQVAQGRQPSGTVTRETLRYGGDRSFVTPNRLSIHLRYFNLQESDSKGRTVAKNVPWFALHIPENLQRRYLFQNL